MSDVYERNTTIGICRVLDANNTLIQRLFREHI